MDFQDLLYCKSRHRPTGVKGKPFIFKVFDKNRGFPNVINSNRSRATNKHTNCSRRIHPRYREVPISNFDFMFFADAVAFPIRFIRFSRKPTRFYDFHFPPPGGGDGGRISCPSHTPSHHAGISCPVRVQPLIPTYSILVLSKRTK